MIGLDRPGLVEALASAVADHDANWLESRMAHLSGQFAGLLRVAVPSDRADALTRALGALQGLEVAVQRSEVSTATPAPRAFVLELLGQDRPGIVRDVARALAVRGVSVDELETSCSSAPMSGELLFRARARLRLPTELELDELRVTLEKIANELMVDLNFDEEE